MTKNSEENDSNVDFLASTWLVRKLHETYWFSTANRSVYCAKRSRWASWQVSIICSSCSTPELEISVPGIWYNCYGRKTYLVGYGIRYNSWYYWHSNCYRLISWLWKISRSCLPCCKEGWCQIPSSDCIEECKARNQCNG